MSVDLKKLDSLVLSNLVDDIECLETIIAFMNNPDTGYVKYNGGRPYAYEEIRESLLRAYQRGYIEALAHGQDDTILESVPTMDGPVESYWFRLTTAGLEEALKPFPWDSAGS